MKNMNRNQYRFHDLKGSAMMKRSITLILTIFIIIQNLQSTIYAIAISNSVHLNKTGGIQADPRRLEFLVPDPRLHYECPEQDYVRLSCSVRYFDQTIPSHDYPSQTFIHEESIPPNFNQQQPPFDPDIFVIWFKDGSILDAGDPAHHRIMPDRMIFKSATGRNDRLIIRSVINGDGGDYRCLVIVTNSTLDPSHLFIRSLLGEVPQSPEEEAIVSSVKPVYLDRNFTISVIPLSYFEGDSEPVVPASLLVSAKDSRTIMSSALSGAPKFIESESWKYKEIVKPAGTRAVIRCPAVGKPKPDITWLKNGYEFTSDVPRVKRKKWFLIMDDLMVYDKGNYTCIVSNIHGSINATFLLDVVEIYPHRPLIIPDYPRNLTLHLGQVATFKCPLFVDMEAAIHWMKVYRVNGSDRDADGVLYSHVIQASQDQVDPTTLIITNVSRNDAGQYYCSASNSIGTSESSAWLKVLDSPELVPEIAALNASTIWMGIDKEGVGGDRHNMGNKLKGRTHKEWYRIIAYIIALVLIIFSAVLILFCRRIRALKKLKPFRLPFGSSPIVADNPFYYHRKVTLEMMDGKYGHDENGAIRAPIVKIQYVPNEFPTIKKTKENKLKSSASVHSNHEMIPTDIPENSEILNKLLSDNPENVKDSDKLTPTEVENFFKNGSMWTDFEMIHDPVWEIPRDSLTLGKQVGEGAFGCVAEAELMFLEQRPSIEQDTTDILESLDLSDKSLEKRNFLKKIVAVKMLKDNASDRELADLVSELELMKVIGHHGNIINLIGCCTSPEGPIYVIVEMAELGNLRDFLRKIRPSSGYEAPLRPTFKKSVTKRLSKSEVDLTEPYHYPNGQNIATASSSPEQSPELSKRICRDNNLTTKDVLNFAHQISQGMEYLSSKKCVHRDLAARNILLTADYVIKIADFGLARDLASQDYYKKNTDGRLPVKWMAPESLFYRRYTIKSDVWSYGIVLWEIATLGGTPYPSLPVEKLFDFLKAGQRLQCPQNCPQELYALMAKCWQENPNKRPSFQQTSDELEKMLLRLLNVEYLDMGISLDTPSICSSTDKQFTFHHMTPPVIFDKSKLPPIHTSYTKIIQDASSTTTNSNNTTISKLEFVRDKSNPEPVEVLELEPSTSTKIYYNSAIFDSLKSTMV